MILPYTEYQAIAANISPNGQAFTDGKFCDAAAGEKFKTTNPATRQVLTSVENCIQVIAIYIKISIKIRSFRVLVTPAGGVYNFFNLLFLLTFFIIMVTVQKPLWLQLWLRLIPKDI